MKNENVCEVKRIVLKIEDKEISLTPEQAKKLKVVLDELFGREIIKEVIREIHEHHDHYNTPYNPYWRWEQPVIWCGGTANIPQYQMQNETINCSL